ncbi:NINE protein [Methylobacterium sp. 37f]|uniref:TM2 domain-containing protein n=1 Tax=Methylobacterium sp. 37f TaxID=2817058 RepID=UPI001FFDDF3E|nr:NINE protein [Methylobacterium sp. 37f]MCK2053597.1 NINE protein [Methylobacterium sp. 37f]
MRGKVLGYDDSAGQGIISGDDGLRYQFVRGALQGSQRILLPGQDVDFVSESGAALNIFVLKSNSLGDRNKLVAALLAFFLGLLGAHKFYLGQTGWGIAYLLMGTVGWVTLGIIPGILAIVCLVEAIVYLTKSDEAFYAQYVAKV